MIRNNNIKKKSDSLIDLTKQSIGIGIVGTAGLGAMGAMGTLTPHGGPAINATSAAVGLAGVGQVAKIGMHIAGQPGKKKTGNSVIDKIL